jgi:hypothetical protein
MQDFRMTRTTIKIGADAAQKEVMYIYNSASFDLIPFNTITNSPSAGQKSIKVQVGNPFVLMRFLLIDLWMIRWVREMKKVNEFYAKKRIHNILSLIVNLRGVMTASAARPEGIKDASAAAHPEGIKEFVTIRDDLCANEDTPLSIFQRTRYIGTYVDESVTIRQKQMHTDKRYADYYPQSYYFKNKSYRHF